jgi:SAM-dependent methyltransferase
MDYSYAVEANFESNGTRENVLIVQADVYQMPFKTASFDRAFCFGVLQHTPDVRAAFMAIPPMVRAGGSIVVDVYKDTFPARALATKYYVRPLTRRIDPPVLYRLTRAWVDTLWPLTRLVARIPKIGSSLNWRLLVPDYRFLGLPEPLLKEWAQLDAFDMLAPRYDTPQTLTTMRRWFDEAGLVDIDVGYGYNGIQGRGRVPVV